MLIGLVLAASFYGTMCMCEKQEQLKERKRQQERLEALTK